MIIKPLITRLVKNWKGLRRVLLASPPRFHPCVYDSKSATLDSTFAFQFSNCLKIHRADIRRMHVDVQRFPLERFIVSFYHLCTQLTIVNEDTIFCYNFLFFSSIIYIVSTVRGYILIGFNRHVLFQLILNIKFNFDSIRSKFKWTIVMYIQFFGTRLYFVMKLLYSGFSKFIWKIILQNFYSAREY